MTNAPFGKVPAWVSSPSCPLKGSVEFGFLCLLAGYRAVRKKRFFYKGKEVILEPGHVCISQRHLAEQLDVSRKRIRNVIAKFKKLQILGPPKGPANGPSNGPVPEIYFFNVDMQLDVFGEPYENPSRPTKGPSKGPKKGPVGAQQGPTSIDDKMLRGLEGSNAPAQARGTDPPSNKPDPEKFLMTKAWTMPRDVETLLEQRFMADLGKDGFWRQVDRFIEHHAKIGEPDDQEGFCRSLANWLERANANRDPPPKVNGSGHANGTGSPANGTGQTTWCDVLLGMDGGKFQNLVLHEYRRAKDLKFMTNREEFDIKAQALAMKVGKADRIGLERVGYWAKTEVLQRLGLTEIRASS